MASGVDRRVVIVAGPTASGKSALALDLAEAANGVVINADSMQIYRELRILTARPGGPEEARAPHRLYGVLPAAEACSVARWRGLALAEIEAAWRAGRVPILAGGTGLYLQALSDGLAPVPDVPADVRTAARDRHARLGGTAFHAALGERDPEMAARLAPGDSQRLIRAWEVVEATGISLAEWQRREPSDGGLSAAFLAIALVPPRSALYAACDARLEEMMGRGALAEVAALDALGLDPGLPAMKALGVRQLRRHLAGRIDLGTAIAAAQQATRNYAKRQLTWIRHRMSDAHIFDTLYSQEEAPRIVEEIRQFMLTAFR